MSDDTNKDCSNGCIYAGGSKKKHCRLVDHIHGDAIKMPMKKAAPAGEYYFNRRLKSDPPPGDCLLFRTEK